MKPTKKAATPLAAPEQPQAEPETVVQDETAQEGTDSPADPEVVVEEQPQAEPDVAPAPESPPASATIPVGTEVRLGQVCATGARVAVSDVLDWLGEAGRGRVAYLIENGVTSSLAAAMLGTDGRCTPAVAARSATPGVMPGLLHGYETIAAAKEAGIEYIPVLFVAPEDVDYVHGFIAQRETARPSSDDDEFEFYLKVSAEEFE